MFQIGIAGFVCRLALSSWCVEPLMSTGGSPKETSPDIVYEQTTTIHEIDDNRHKPTLHFASFQMHLIRPAAYLPL
jgi:hypothetical protein